MDPRYRGKPARSNVDGADEVPKVAPGLGYFGAIDYGRIVSGRA